MEDGDLWQAYADANVLDETLTTDDEIVTNMDSENAATEALDDVSSAASVAAKNNVDVGPPVNIYAEAHRHAQIKAADSSDDAKNDNADGVKESGNNTREGPHASLHLSNELKQNQKKLSDETNEQVTDSLDESRNDGTNSMDENSVSEAEAAVGSSTDNAHTDNGVANESVDNNTDPKTESTSDSDIENTNNEDQPTTSQPNRTRTVSEDEDDDERPSKIILVDYASKLAGAQVLEKSPSFKGASNLLTGDSDKYAIAPCEDKKYVVIGLSEDILVKQIKLSNFERYSSHVREFQVLASQEYPAPSAEYWTLIGTFEANARNGEQTFDLEEPAWARYLKFKFRSHFGAEHYCTLSQIKVHGSTMLQGFHEQWIESEKELEQKKENQQQQQGDHERGEVGDSDVQQIHHETDLVEDKMEEQLAKKKIDNGVEEGGVDADDMSQQNPPESIVAYDENDGREENDALHPSQHGISDGESPPDSDDEIDSDPTSSNEPEEELAERGDKDLIDTDINGTASDPYDESIDQPVVTEVPRTTTVDGEKIEEEEKNAPIDQDITTDAGNPEQLGELDDDVGEVDQEGSDEAAYDDIVAAVVEEESVDAMPSEVANTDGQLLSGDASATSNDNNEDATETSSDITEGQDDKNSDENIDRISNTDDNIASTSAPTTSDKQSGDAKTVYSDSGVTHVRNSAKGDTNSNTKDRSSESVETNVGVNTPIAEKNGVKFAELVSTMAKRFPHASCIKELDFHSFKTRALLANASQMGQVPGPKGSGQVPGPKMEPIFAKITNEIKAVQMTQHQYEQYISAVKTCYEKLFLDMANDLDSIQRDYDRRLSILEDAISNIAPDVFPKPFDYKLITISSIAAFINCQSAQFGLIVGLAILITVFGLRRKKTTLKKASGARTAKEAAVLPSTPTSSTNSSPLTNNNWPATKHEDEPFLQHESLRIISSEEKENTSCSVVSVEAKEQIDTEFASVLSIEEKSKNCSTPLAQNVRVQKKI